MPGQPSLVCQFRRDKRVSKIEQFYRNVHAHRLKSATVWVVRKSSVFGDTFAPRHPIETSRLRDDVAPPQLCAAAAIAGRMSSTRLSGVIGPTKRSRITPCRSMM